MFNGITKSRYAHCPTLFTTSPHKNDAQQIFDLIVQEHTETVEQVLQITNQSELMEHSQKIKNQILRRNPFVDPLNMMQINLLSLWRKRSRPLGLSTSNLHYQLLETINGISAGIRNYG